jgi:hypothetical protein
LGELGERRRSRKKKKKVAFEKLKNKRRVSQFVFVKSHILTLAPPYHYTQYVGCSVLKSALLAERNLS